jgi:mono/diheme cytochrome c family protein
MRLLLYIAGLLGSTAPDISLFTPDERTWRLSDALREKPSVLLHASGCKETVPVPDSVRLLAIRPSACGGYRDPSGAARRYLGEAKAVLLDRNGVVRLVAADDLKAFGVDVSRWTAGREIYTAQCQRCHGADGRDTHYSGIKTLAGLGKRISRTEIIERTIRSGNVDLSPMDEEARRALAVYVAGL